MDMGFFHEEMRAGIFKAWLQFQLPQFNSTTQYTIEPD